jgi:hypothetical protein
MIASVCSLIAFCKPQCECKQGRYQSRIKPCQPLLPWHVSLRNPTGCHPFLAKATESLSSALRVGSVLECNKARDRCLIIGSHSRPQSQFTMRGTLFGKRDEGAIPVKKGCASTTQKFKRVSVSLLAPPFNNCSDCFLMYSSFKRRRPKRLAWAVKTWNLC